VNGSVDINDHELAAFLASRAAALLMDLRTKGQYSGKELGAQGDAQANALILGLLKEARPHDAYLSEESAPDPVRLARERVWIIDPLDGTREYAESNDGRGDWAVHIALTEGGRPTASAVALPAQGVVLGTHELQALPPAPPMPLKILVSRTRAPELALKVAHTLGAELVPMGSAGAKAMAVLQGRAHAYLHAGGQYEWDSCAPVGVALAAGLHASRIDGSLCRYNRADVFMPDLLVCRPEHAEALLAAIQRATF
jgi:3'(2'), 5'-bisphosphate nucleotidase